MSTDFISINERLKYLLDSWYNTSSLKFLLEIPIINLFDNHIERIDSESFLLQIDFDLSFDIQFKINILFFHQYFSQYLHKINYESFD